MRLVSLLVLALTFFGQASYAQTFPDHVVTLVVPYAAGGGVDALARAMADRLTTLWGKTVIIENRPGATTIIGARSVARSQPDGHTLLMTTDSTVTSNPHFFPKEGFNPLTDLVPVTQIAYFDLMLLVHPSVPAKNVEELIAYARSNKGLPYASFGFASQAHVFFAALAKLRDLDLVHVPYNGIAPSLQAVLTGEVKMSMAGAGTAGGLVSAGKLRALALAAPERNPRFPDIPTFGEVGLGDLDPTPWFGLFAPRGTPPALVEKISKDVIGVIKQPDFEEKFITSRNYFTIAKPPAEFAKAIAEELPFRGRQIELSGIKMKD